MNFAMTWRRAFWKPNSPPLFLDVRNIFNRSFGQLIPHEATFGARNLGLGLSKDLHVAECSAVRFRIC